MSDLVAASAEGAKGKMPVSENSYHDDEHVAQENLKPFLQKLLPVVACVRRQLMLSVFMEAVHFSLVIHLVIHSTIILRLEYMKVKVTYLD